MARPTKDPSGAQLAVTVKVPPRILEAIGVLVDRRQVGRSELICQLVSEALGGELPAEPEVREVACQHPRKTVIAGGMARCVECGAVRGTDGSWR